MDRQRMHDYLRGLDLSQRYPIWVISYNRAGKYLGEGYDLAPSLKYANSSSGSMVGMDDWGRTEDVNVLVRRSQADAYRAAYPNLTIHSLPDSQIDMVGKARWAAASLAYVLGHEIITMMDDDVLYARFLFERTFFRGANAGRECSGHAVAEDYEALPDLGERVITAMSDVAREVFENHPNVMIGGAIKQHMSFDYKNHRTKYAVNSGVTPRQCMIWHVGRMMDAGISLDIERFGIHGDDIGLVAQILAAGGDSFAMPSFVYEHWPESININKSTLRDGTTSKALHEFEWESLQQYPIRDYLRVKRNKVDGSYQWGDVNWKALHKIRGTEPIKVPWDPAQPIDGEPNSLI